MFKKTGTGSVTEKPKTLKEIKVEKEEKEKEKDKEKRAKQ